MEDVCVWFVCFVLNDEITQSWEPSLKTQPTNHTHILHIGDPDVITWYGKPSSVFKIINKYISTDYVR